MTDDRLAVRVARGEREVAEALALRHVVFVVEQGVPIPDEIDGRDGDAVHLVAYERGALAGTCRVLAEEGDPGTWRLGRMAVAGHARRRGVAARLLAAAEEAARERGATRMVLAAQAGIEALYGRAGYALDGERFMDAGIEHVPMAREL